MRRATSPYSRPLPEVAPLRWSRLSAGDRRLGDARRAARGPHRLLRRHGRSRDTHHGGQRKDRPGRRAEACPPAAGCSSVARSRTRCQLRRISPAADPFPSALCQRRRPGTVSRHAPSARPVGRAARSARMVCSSNVSPRAICASPSRISASAPGEERMSRVSPRDARSSGEISTVAARPCLLWTEGPEHWARRAHATLRPLPPGDQPVSRW